MIEKSFFEIAVAQSSRSQTILVIFGGVCGRNQSQQLDRQVLVGIGLGVLPIYWFFWKNARNTEYDSARKWLTVVLAAMVWYMFLVGHILNNVRGLGS